MTETTKIAEASPRLIASCGPYRVLVDGDGFQLEKLASGGGLPAQWETIASKLSTVELVASYQRETGLFSSDLMALSGATFDDHSRLA